jgi:hypothetical protein
MFHSRITHPFLTGHTNEDRNWFAMAKKHQLLNVVQMARAIKFSESLPMCPFKKTLRNLMYTFYSRWIAAKFQAQQTKRYPAFPKTTKR